MCSNAALGYQIAYVPGWYTTGSTDALTCRFFDQSPLTVTTDSPLPATAIRIYLGGHSYAEEDARYAASKPYVVQRYPVTVEGHAAFAVEAHTTSGQKAFAIIIDLGQDTLVMDTWSERDGDFGSWMSYVIALPFGDRHVKRLARVAFVMTTVALPVLGAHPALADDPSTLFTCPSTLGGLPLEKQEARPIASSQVDDFFGGHGFFFECSYVWNPHPILGRQDR